MSIIPAQHQGIAFNAYGAVPFNELGICDCPSQDNQYAYLIKEGDITPIQFVNDCQSSELGEEIISNGGFEQGDGSTDITDWTRTVVNPEDTNVVRSTLDPYEGTYLALWTHLNEGASTQADLSQTTAQTFVAGELYLLEFYCKMTINGSSPSTYNDYLIITIGGLYVFTFTPPRTSDYFKISRYVPMDFNGTDSDIIIGVETTNPNSVLENYFWGGMTQ